MSSRQTIIFRGRRRLVFLVQRKRQLLTQLLSHNVIHRSLLQVSAVLERYGVFAVFNNIHEIRVKIASLQVKLFHNGHIKHALLVMRSKTSFKTQKFGDCSSKCLFWPSWLLIQGVVYACNIQQQANESRITLKRSGNDKSQCYRKRCCNRILYGPQLPCKSSQNYFFLAKK